MTPDAPSAAPVPDAEAGADKISNDEQRFFEEWAENITWAGGETAEWIGHFFVDLPVGAAKGIRDVLADNIPSKAQLEEVLQGTRDFILNAPSATVNLVTDLLTKDEVQIQSVETLKNLTDDIKWIEAFDGLDLETEDKTPPPSGVYGPKELLMSLEVSRRKEMFVDHVEKYISPDTFAGDTAMRLFSKEGVDEYLNDKNAFFSNSDRKALMTSSIKQMFGLEDPTKNNSNATEIARASLREHFINPNAFDKDTGSYAASFTERDGRTTLEDAMVDARRRGVRFDASFLENYESLADQIPPSRFRGALRLGLAQSGREEQMRNLLKHIDARLDEKAADAADVQVSTTKNLEELTDELARKNRLEAKTMRQIWDDLPAYGKLMIAAAGLYVAFKNKGLAAGMVGVYAFQKFALKHDKPTEMWTKTLQNVAQGVWGPAGKIAEKAGLKDPELCNAERSAVMIKYLSETERREYESAATGYSLLADVPINELMAQFDASKDGKSGVFTLPSGCPLDHSIKNSLAKRKNATYKYHEFFDKSENRDQVADALAHLCYTIGAEDDPEAAKLVEEKIPAGGTYDDIEDPDARTAYAQLVDHGEAKSATIKETLMQHIEKEMEEIA